MSDSFCGVGERVSGGRHGARQLVLIAAAQAMFGATGMAVHKFAERLAEHYVRLVPEGQRSTALRVAPPNDSDAYLRLMNSNYRIVQRWLSGAVVFPVELEEPWIESLDQLFRDRCVFELCVRLGALPVLINVNANAAELGQLMRDEADAIMALAPIFSDGRIDAGDVPHAPEAINTLRRVISDCAGIIHQLEALQRPDESAVSVVGGLGHA